MPPQPTPSPNRPAEAPMRIRVQTILVVDDEPDILQSLDALFVASLPSVRCLTATSGTDALALLAKHKVDLILSDFKMPGMDGLAFLERAKAVAPQVPRMLLTAFPDLDVAMQAINEAGVETFLTKPLDAHRIVRVVGAALAKRRAKEDRDVAMGRAVAVRRANGGA